MYIHLIIFFLALIGLSIYKETGTPLQQKNARKKYIIFMMLLLMLQSGLRNLAVGADTYQYYLKFTDVLQSSWAQVLSEVSQGTKDPGYVILSKLFATIVPSFRLFLIVIAIFFFFALGRLLYKYLNSNLDVLVSIALYECLYYGFFSITGLRQTIATGVLLLTIPLILEKEHKIKNTIHFFILLLLASFIHKSAVIFAPVYFLSLFRKNKYVFFAAVLLFVPMFAAGPIISQFLEGTDFERYSQYLGQSNTAGANVFTLYIVLLVIATLIKLKTINSLSPYYYVFTSAIAISMLLSPLLILNPNNMRIVQYYSIFGLIVLPQFGRAYSGVVPRRLICFSIFAVLAAYTVLRHEPYAFFWQDMYFENTGEILNDSRF